MDHTLVAAAAANLAAWHDCSLGALGVASYVDGGWWRAAQAAPSIYHSAITLEPAHGRTERRQRVRSLLDWAEREGTFLSVCDSFGELDLRPLGIGHRARTPWFVRRSSPDDRLPAAAAVDGFATASVVTEVDLVAFERTVVRSFGARPPVTDLDIHAPGILADPAMHVVLGRLDGVPVGVAMGYESAGVLGIYGVGVVPEARGRGLATALTVTVLSRAPGRTATLQPSPAAEGLYRRLGFEPAGWYDHWC